LIATERYVMKRDVMSPILVEGLQCDV